MSSVNLVHSFAKSKELLENCLVLWGSRWMEMSIVIMTSCSKFEAWEHPLYIVKVRLHTYTPLLHLSSLIEELFAKWKRLLTYRTSLNAIVCLIFSVWNFFRGIMLLQNTVRNPNNQEGRPPISQRSLLKFKKLILHKKIKVKCYRRFNSWQPKSTCFCNNMPSFPFTDEIIPPRKHIGRWLECWLCHVFLLPSINKFHPNSHTNR